MSDNQLNAADIAQALNSICAELKTLNRTLGQLASASQDGPKPGARSSYSASADQSPGYGGRPRPTGAAGRIHNKRARDERLGGATKTRKSKDFAGPKKAK